MSVISRIQIYQRHVILAVIVIVTLLGLWMLFGNGLTFATATENPQPCEKWYSDSAPNCQPQQPCERWHRKKPPECQPDNKKCPHLNTGPPCTLDAAKQRITPVEPQATD